MKQPSFADLFFQSLGGKPKKLSYSVRSDSNRLHDLWYLASLIHDARFPRSCAIVRRKRLRLDLRRHCWELGPQPSPRPGHADLFVSSSLLTVSPVQDIEWRFLDPGGLVAEELEIDALFPAEDLWFGGDPLAFSLVLAGIDWQCRLTCPCKSLHLSLRDTTVPVLAGQRSRQSAPGV